jgi:hypothetical protein
MFFLLVMNPDASASHPFFGDKNSHPSVFSSRKGANLLFGQNAEPWLFVDRAAKSFNILPISELTGLKPLKSRSIFLR